jgi:hypothetical protein
VVDLTPQFQAILCIGELFDTVKTNLSETELSEEEIVITFKKRFSILPDWKDVEKDFKRMITERMDFL